MRKLLTAGIFGTILGIVGTGTANASIVSSGFLDEKLTEYALSTSLDLKANQSDFTELNTQISESVDNLKSLWDADIGILAYGVDPNKFNNDIIGAFGLVEGFFLYSMESLTRGWTSSDINVRLENYYDYNPGLEGMFNGWTIYDPSGSETMVYKGLENISSQIRTIEDTYHTGLARLLVNGENKINVEAYNYTGPIYPLWKLSEGIDKIGDLPSGSLLGLSPDSDQIYKVADGTDTPVYPANVAEMIQQLYGAPQAGHRGIIPVIGRNISDLSKSITTRIGTLPDGKTVTDMISETDAKIGDLPTEIPNTAPIWEQYGFAEMGTPIDLPDTIGGMFAMLFSDYGSYNEPSLATIMARILMGFSSSSNVRFEGLSSLTSVYKLVGDSPIVTAVKANTAKIGTLPDGYDSVGAALTAIKGIAEDAKAAALAAIPDPKQEGSSGKFVLTVDIVGDNATYRWEKIDREGETTTTTE